MGFTAWPIKSRSKPRLGIILSVSEFTVAINLKLQVLTLEGEEQAHVN